MPAVSITASCREPTEPLHQRYCAQPITLTQVNSIPRKTRHPFCAPESISISQADRSHLLEATKQSTLVAFCPMVARKMPHVLLAAKDA